MSKQLTADQINLEWLEEATVDSLKSAMRAGGDVLNAVNALLLTPEGKKIAFEMLNDPDYKPKSQRPVDPEEQAQIAADEQRAAQQAAEAAAEAEAQAQADAEAAAQAAAQQEPPKKIVVDYQATDEDGRPIGRPTHIEGWTNEEVIEKMKAAHINAVRYAERIKSNRFKQSVAAMNVAERGAAAKQASERSAQLAEEAVNAKDPEKMKQAVKESVAAERQAQEAEEAARQHGKIVAETWMADHVEDFLPCQASSSIMGDYMKANGLSMTYDNLETAFKAVKNQLPKPESVPGVDAVSAPPANNTPVVAPVVKPAAPASIPPAAVPAAATVPASQPQAVPQASATAPTSTPVTANQPTVTRKPVVNGGLQPGTLSAARPEIVTQSPTETRSDLLRQIAKMPAQEYRKKLRTDSIFVAKLKAAGIPVVGQ